MQIFKATLAHIEETSRLFDAYRQFYGQAPDSDEATRFIGERLQGRIQLSFWHATRRESVQALSSCIRHSLPSR